MDTDTVNKKLYFTEHQGNDVKRANYDGSAIEYVWQGRTTVDFPADVAVDAEAGKVFMTIQSVPTLLNGTLVRVRACLSRCSVWMCARASMCFRSLLRVFVLHPSWPHPRTLCSQQVQNLDGTGLTILYSGLIQNYGLCLDRYAKHVYYIQGGNGGSISCHAYGTTPCNTTTKTDGIVIDQLQYPYMCDVDNVWAPYGGPTRVCAPVDECVWVYALIRSRVGMLADCVLGAQRAWLSVPDEQRWQ